MTLAAMLLPLSVFLSASFSFPLSLPSLSVSSQLVILRGSLSWFPWEFSLWEMTFWISSVVSGKFSPCQQLWSFIAWGVCSQTTCGSSASTEEIHVRTTHNYCNTETWEYLFCMISHVFHFQLSTIITPFQFVSNSTSAVAYCTPFA